MYHKDSDPYMVQKWFPYTKMTVGTWWSNLIILHLVKNHLERLYGWENLPFSTIFRFFWGLFAASVTQLGLKRGSLIPNWSLKRGGELTLVKKTLLLVKNDLKRLHGWKPTILLLNGKFSQPYSRLRSFLTKTNDFVTRVVFGVGEQSVVYDNIGMSIVHLSLVGY